MFKTANPGRLTDLLDNVFSGNALLQHECRQLATGFVGCNLVADLADFVTNVANSASGGVVGGPAPPSFAKLRGWLIEPPADWDALAELIGPAGAAAMANGSHHFDRWWQINRWLGVEASLQMLAPSSTAAVPPPSVLNHAQATAEKVLAASKAQPQPCRQRNAAVVQAFAPWLRATVVGVARLWRQHGWHQQAGNQHLVGLLARELGAGCQPLTTLTGTKNNQWLNCLQQLNQACGGRCPTPDGWLVDCAGQPTTDPGVLYTEPRGSILPFGGPQAYKGFGLGLMLDLLAGGLSGGRCSNPNDPMAGVGNAVVFVLFDPAAFGGVDHFLNQTDALTGYVRSCPTAPGGSGIVLPGDPERSAKAQRLADGIDIPDGTWNLLTKTAAELGVATLA